ncbi:MAG TPA: Bro-N domain-containing protein [Candidatus Onthousia faecipullorum]|uniref:Bro-N domain-containing protein n=1 Tax=Candidatus Onthousia faecipullorum TaxID=2840887 RepID=A0A9D1GAR7_9FIRM|nr:Bro-N domain-containing protein [Candidatus Onthousia faecipullorum]
MNNKLALFEEKEIRRTYQEGKWYFSVVDVVFALTNSKDPKQYINKLRKRDETLNKGWVQIVHPLKLDTNGGKQSINCADTEGILRIIQSIPSKKAEPFKRWLAKVGSERIEEIQNPELAMDRMKELYEKKGYSKSWINMRERGIATRHNLTDEWKERGISKGIEYAILTNEIYKSGFGVTAKEYKDIKGLHESENLRDSMTNIELALTNLGEATAVEFHKKNDSKGLKELKNDMSEAGNVINSAKKEIERKLERPIVTSDNYIELTEDYNLKLPN